MRFVLYGAGAIGGTIGARLFEGGHDVVLIARGAHLAALREHGLRFRTPGGERILSLPVVGSPGELDWRGDEVVILAMKTQDTAPALAAPEAQRGPACPWSARKTGWRMSALPRADSSGSTPCSSHSLQPTSSPGS